MKRKDRQTSYIQVKTEYLYRLLNRIKELAKAGSLDAKSIAPDAALVLFESRAHE